MITQELLDMTLEWTKDSAEADLLNPGDPTFPPKIGVVKDETLHAWVFPKAGGGESRPADDILEAAFPVIVGMEADEIILAHDTCQIDLEKVKAHSPERVHRDEDGDWYVVKRDGTRFASGDMQKALAEGTEDAQDITEALVVQVYDRLGNVALSQVPYTRENGKLVWGERRDLFAWAGEGNTGPMGYLADNLKEMFRRPTMTQHLAAQAELEEELAEATWVAEYVMAGNPMPSPKAALEWANAHPKEAFASQVAYVTVYSLAPMGIPVMIAVSDEETATYYKEVFVRLQLSDEVPAGPDGTQMRVEQMHLVDHPLAGKTVAAHPFVELSWLTEGATFRVDNWVDMMPAETRRPWRVQAEEDSGNLALQGYLHRIKDLMKADPERGARVFLDSDAVYGHVVRPGNAHGYGYVVHASELGEEVPDVR